MANQNWVSLLTPGIPAAGAPFTVGASTATLSPVLGAVAAGDSAQVSAPGQYLGWQAGMLIRVTARGFITTTTTAGTLTFLLATRLNNAGSTYVTISGAHQTLNSFTTATTGIPWKLEGLIRCTAVASSGNTIATQAEMQISAVPATAQTINTATAGLNIYLPSASGETATAVDTTQAQGISLRVTGTAATGTVQCTQWLVEAMN
jgi:hypothetical protein